MDEPVDPPAAVEEAVPLHHADRDEAVLARDPGNRGALHRLSVLRLKRGAFEDAVGLLERLIECDPNSSGAHNNLGAALQGLKRSADAVPHLEKAIGLEPNRPEAYYNLGLAQQSLGRLVEARECCERAIALRPDYAEANNTLAVLLAPNDPERALACFGRAIAARPGYADAYNNMGIVLQGLGRYEEALASYTQALAIKPDHADAHNNLGLALRSLNRHEEAIACFEIAQAIKPDHVDGQLGEGLVRLALGDYATGWKKYAWRHLTANFSHGKKRPPQPLWLGNWNISGKTILLHGEQGLGDTIMFARYVPMVAQRGAKVILAVQRPLTALMATLKGASVVRGQGEPVPPFDGFCPLPTLPLVFRTSVETIPATVPYLSAPADRVAKWRPVLQALPRPRIGLMWAGAQSPIYRRTIPLRLLLPLFELREFHFVALQKELPDEDAPFLDSTRMATFLGDRQVDLADTAAIIATLDLVITVDTSIAHLAGALGKPVWVLLPFSADWRWLRHRDDSPWYPTARLFRQPALGDWAGVVTQVGNAVRLCAARSGPSK
jgi:tetratricopeptide (TPR) repeat protein